MNKFLGNGYISLTGVDAGNRKAIFSINMPYCMLMSVCEPMIQGGVISDLVISDVFSVWQLEIKEENVKDDFLKVRPDLASMVWRDLKAKIESFMAYYVDICHILKDTSILSSALPMGTYINIKYTCDVDSILKTLTCLQDMVHLNGIAEFQYALAEALADALKSID